MVVAVPLAQEVAILDAEVIGVHPEFPHDAVLQFVEPCPFCGERHVHYDDKNVAVGAILHRSAHCTSDRPRRRGRGPRGSAPNGEYYLRVVANPFMPQTEDTGVEK